MRGLLLTILAAAALLATRQTDAADFSQDFAVVAIDANAEARHGPMPLPRELLAQALERIAADGARGAVLKFFLDLPRTENGDARLASAIGLLPTALQARLDDANGSAGRLPSKFHIVGDVRTKVGGKSGWLPLPRFAARATAIGFVDFTTSLIPLAERYQDLPVASLTVSAIELATGAKAEWHPDRVSFGRKGIALDSEAMVSAPFKPISTSMVESLDTVLSGNFKPGRFRGKVVFLIYDGANGAMVDTPAGKISAHMMFLALMRGLYEDQLKN